MSELRDKLWPQLEAKGEEQVRLEVASNVYAGNKLSHVDEWLRQKVQDRSNRRDSRRQTTDMVAAIAATVAAIAATIGAIASIMTLLSD